jgi:diacylglycerol kinase (ATP)
VADVRLIVYNPRGGAALRGHRLRAALATLRALPGEYETVATEATDMAGPVARALSERPDVTQIVACGGDGTAAACAAALGGRDIPIAIIPTGTTNVLAYELGLPTHPVRAARLLGATMRQVPFRTWSVNGRTMLLQLGVGFDGLLMWRTSRRVKRALGFAGVVASALRLGVSFDYPEMRVSGELADGGALNTVVTSVMVANAKRWAGPQLTVPTADPSDEVADVLLLQYRSLRELATFWIATLLPGAPHLRLAYVRHARMRALSIEALGRAVEAHIDGEPAVMTPIRVHPLGCVHLLAPPIA